MDTHTIIRIVENAHADLIEKPHVSDRNAGGTRFLSFVRLFDRDQSMPADRLFILSGFDNVQSPEGGPIMATMEWKSGYQTYSLRADTFGRQVMLEVEWQFSDEDASVDEIRLVTRQLHRIFLAMRSKLEAPV